MVSSGELFFITKAAREVSALSRAQLLKQAPPTRILLEDPKGHRLRHPSNPCRGWLRANLDASQPSRQPARARRSEPNNPSRWFPYDTIRTSLWEEGRRRARRRRLRHHEAFKHKTEEDGQRDNSEFIIAPLVPSSMLICVIDLERFTDEQDQLQKARFHHHHHIEECIKRTQTSTALGTS